MYPWVGVCRLSHTHQVIISPGGYEGKHLDETEGISVVLAAGALIRISSLRYNNVAPLINSTSVCVYFLLVFLLRAYLAYLCLCFLPPKEVCAWLSWWKGMNIWHFRGKVIYGELLWSPSLSIPRNTSLFPLLPFPSERKKEEVGRQSVNSGGESPWQSEVEIPLQITPLSPPTPQPYLFKMISLAFSPPTLFLSLQWANMTPLKNGGKRQGRLGELNSARLLLPLLLP